MQEKLLEALDEIKEKILTPILKCETCYHQESKVECTGTNGECLNCNCHGCIYRHENQYCCLPEIAVQSFYFEERD